MAGYEYCILKTAFGKLVGRATVYLNRYHEQ